MEKLPRLIAFDLDGTLAVSKSPASAEMGEALSSLSRQTGVAVITGGKWSQVTGQLLPVLDPGTDIAMLPTSGGSCLMLRADGQGYTPIWDEVMPEDERAAVVAALEEAVERHRPGTLHRFGPLIEDRGAQVTLSILGQLAPPHEKETWAVENEGCLEIFRDTVASLLPGHEVRTGGSTSIDVTPRGWDKARGLTRLLETLGLEVADVLYVGDRLDPGGNDHPVRLLGVTCVPTRGPDDTLELIRQLLDS